MKPFPTPTATNQPIEKVTTMADTKQQQAATRREVTTATLVALAILCVLVLCWYGLAPGNVQRDEQAVVPPPIPQRDSAPAAIADANTGAESLKFGYTPNREATEAFVASLDTPTIREASPGMFAAETTGDKREVFLFRAHNAAHRDRFGKDWSSEAQGIGDCVSWGWAHAIDVHSAVCYAQGETSEWWPAATESIYGGSRVEARGVSFGGWSDGSYGSAAAKWVSEWGVTWRKRYDASQIDLSIYSAQRAKQWGAYGNGGQNDNYHFDEVAKEFPVKGVTLVTTFAEAAAAISSGYPVPVCSSQGFASRRDDKGFSRPSGTWYHCMCFVAVRWNPPGLLCQNSWGTTWIDGPKYPDDQPEGSFWVDEQTCDRMLAGRDSFAVSRVKEFPVKPIDHSTWARGAPATEPIFALAL